MTEYSVGDDFHGATLTAIEPGADCFDLSFTKGIHGMNLKVPSLERDRKYDGAIQYWAERLTK